MVKLKLSVVPSPEPRTVAYAVSEFRMRSVPGVGSCPLPTEGLAKVYQLAAVSMFCAALPACSISMTGDGAKVKLLTAEYSTFFAGWQSQAYSGMSMIGSIDFDGDPSGATRNWIGLGSIFSFSYQDAELQALLDRSRPRPRTRASTSGEIGALLRTIWHIGVLSPQRRRFWRLLAKAALRGLSRTSIAIPGFLTWRGLSWRVHSWRVSDTPSWAWQPGLRTEIQ